MSDRRARSRLTRRPASVRAAASTLVVALALLPAACFCAPAAAEAVQAAGAPAHPCHGGDDQRAPLTPQHSPACAHCQATVALPGAAQGTVSLPPAALAQAAAPPARDATDTSWAARSHAPPSPEHPPGRALLRRKCVLLV